MNDVNIINLLRKWFRGLSIAALAFYTANLPFYEAFKSTEFQEKFSIYIFFIVVIFPIAAYSVGVLFFLSRWRLIRLKGHFLAITLISGILLLAPAILSYPFLKWILNLNNSIIENAAYFITVGYSVFVSSVILCLGKGWNIPFASGIVALGDHILQVFWWKDPTVDDFGPDKEILRRNSLFTDKNRISEFQKNIFSLEAEAEWLSNNTQVAEIIEKRKNFKVLDLGCGDGRFIQALLKRIDSSVTVEITAVDACNFRKAIIKNLKEIHGEFPLNFHNQPIKDFLQQSKDLQFDLVICSHSLYSELRAGHDASRDIEAICNILWKKVSPEGLLYISLSSRFGSSNIFKSSFFLALTPEPPSDVFFEGTIERISAQLENKSDAAKSEIGILDSALGIPDNSKSRVLAFEYFLRFNLSTQSGLIALLDSLIDQHSIPFCSLPEHIKSYLTRSYSEEFASEPPESERRILLHKSKTYLLSKKS